MVCSIGSGRMAVMARLLAAESFPQTMAEEVVHQKLPAQYFYRELREADEANLLDEEDMHVFGLKPMADSLQLVCCNACKKPVRASQYVAHAELCRSLHSIEDTIMEVESGMGHKKPPRKDRKKLLSAHPKQATAVEQERCELINADDTVVQESKLEGQIGIRSSSAMEAKKNSDSVAVTYVINSFGICPGNTDYSDIMTPPTKRSKLIAGGHLPLSNDLESSGVTKRTSTQDAFTCRGFSKRSVCGSEIPTNECIHDFKKHGEVYTCCLPLTDVPIPLATKTYYSQGSNRLRSALTHLYCKASANEVYIDAVSPNVSLENMTLLQTSSQDSSLEPMDDLNKKKQMDKFSMPPVQNSDLILAQSSEICLGKLGRSSPAMNSPDEVPVDGVSMSEMAPVGLIRSKYLLNPYSLAVNSGKPLGMQQQPNGSVPVT